MAVVIHVGGLWITSPPDMIDALLFTSPTPFSPFGVIAMWAIFAVGAFGGTAPAPGTAAAHLAHCPHAARDRHRRRRPWLHGILIEGAMETVSKAALCALVLAATIKVMADLRVWRKRATLRGESSARP